jgi:flagellar basal-body rod protein FlgG
MITALWTASTGMEAQMTHLDVIAHNLSNANTVAFKKSRADFQDLLYQSLEIAGSSTSADTLDPTGAQVGVGTKLAGITKEFTTGSLQRTDRDLDVAVTGKGFIQVQGADGQLAYTRDGSFKLSPEGTIVTSDGFPVQGLGAIPANARSVNFGQTGEVSYVDETGVETLVGQLQLAVFLNPSGLEAQGGNLYKPTDASGVETLVQPGLQGAGKIQQHFLEMSNVSIVEEMVSMITTQRAYEVNSKMIKAADEMLATANQIS